MKNTFKSLLLASTAALTSHSVFAADAVVIEAEPVEYVRVCDMYGAGFFYLPGSETCLKIYGDVRVDYSSTKYHNDRLNGISTHDVTARGRIGFTAQSQTEYGTLGTNILISGTRSDSATPHDVFSTSEGLDGGIGISTATINLAGFRTGYDDDGGGAWNRYGGYGYYEARNDGLYSFQTAIFFEYGGSVGDFNYVVGIQDSGQSGSSGSPDAYIGANTVFGGLALQAVVLRDSNGGETVNGGDGALAYRIRGDYDLSSAMPGLGIGAWYEADGGKTDYVKGHKWGVTAHVNMTEKLTVFAGYSEYTGQLTAKGLDTSNYTVGARWNLVSDLYIQPEYSANWSDNEGLVGDNNGVFNLRIVRSF